MRLAFLLMASLSEDDVQDRVDENNATLLTQQQRKELKLDGFCAMPDPMKNEQIVDLIRGFIRTRFADQCMVSALLRIIIQFYNSRYNVDVYAELISVSDAHFDEALYFLIPRKSLSLSRVLSHRIDSDGSRVEVDQKQVSADALRSVLRYLGHHRGVKPPPIARPIRSLVMAQIVQDPWDVEFVDEMNNAQRFPVITAANYLDIESLMHLGCAKTATLIKGKSPQEIKNILAA